MFFITLCLSVFQVTPTAPLSCVQFHISHLILYIKGPITSHVRLVPVGENIPCLLPPLDHCPPVNKVEHQEEERKEAKEGHVSPAEPLGPFVASGDLRKHILIYFILNKKKSNCQIHF